MATPLILSASFFEHPYSVPASIQSLAWSPRSLRANAAFTGFERAADQNRDPKINNQQSHVEGYPTG